MGGFMSNTRIVTCALAVAGTLFISSQAMAQGGPAAGINANIVNSPTVNVGNTAALAAAIAKELRGTPVTISLSGANSFYSVPVGQRLVVEYASGRCRPGGSNN